MKKQNIRTTIWAATFGTAALALGLIATPASADPTISNGSFETPDISPALFSNVNISSWSSVGGMNLNGIPGASLADNALAATIGTPYGSQWLFLNTGKTNDTPNPSHDPKNVYVWQKIGTVEKGVYTFNYLLQSRFIDASALSTDGFFLISLWAGGDAPFDATDRPTVLGAGTYAVQLGLDSTIDVPSQNSTNAESSTFVLTNTPYVGQDLWLRLHLTNNPATGGFAASSFNSLNQMLFDNVTVSFVPEPTSLMLLALGGGLMALRRRQ